MHLFVDIIIESGCEKIILIDRGVLPHGWALPGGAVDKGESPLVAAVREVEEETGLIVKINRLFSRYSFVDGAGEITGDTLVFIAKIVGGSANASSDAKAVQEFSFAEIPPLIIAHERILADYFDQLDSGEALMSVPTLPSFMPAA